MVKKGNIPWNKGKTGLQVAWNKGKPMSEKSKNKLSQSQKLRMLNPEVKQTISDSMLSYYSNSENLRKFREIMNSPQVRENKSKALKGLKRSPESIRRISESQCGKVLSKEHKEKISKSTKLVLNTPEIIEKKF